MAKAFRRAGLWQPDSWLPPEERPSPVCILRDHAGLDVPEDVARAALEENYRTTMWEVGGE